MCAQQSHGDARGLRMPSGEGGAPNETSGRQAAGGGRIASLLLVALLPQGSWSRIALRRLSAAWLAPVVFGALARFPRSVDTPGRRETAEDLAAAELLSIGDAVRPVREGLALAVDLGDDFATVDFATVDFANHAENFGRSFGKISREKRRAMLATGA
ncbi:hypothetical protein [Sorangium sp. So ce887]|uniref:hypothetical protein n=1 Tax=Sorangium sp. So ce887 TaxID=3133324 RepID=UPI003F5FE3CB